MKNPSPISGYVVGKYFNSWCVRSVRANGERETVNVCDTLDGAKTKLARRAEASGFVLASDGMSAARKKED